MRASEFERGGLDRAMRSGRLLPIIFGTTLFVSAALLFVVQPMIAKMLLPLLGGAPAVWNTAIVVFQALLLAGYAYAFALSKLSRIRVQAIVHVAVLLLILVALPVALPADWQPPAVANPIPSVIAVLFLAVGAPFFALAASAPLFQNWFAHTGHAEAHNPYFLYAPSNLGGLVALLAYPVVIEPNLRLATQSWSWSGGFVVLVVLAAACAIFLRSDEIVEAPQAEVTAVAAAAGGVAGLAERLRWLLLAFAPASLLLGVTNFLTTDIAAIPLFWVVPLALYLATFAIVFARKPMLSHPAMVMLQPVLVLPLVLWLFWQPTLPLWSLFTINLLAFFAAAMVCHGELARTRPATARLTEFYLWLALGGVLGGAFNALAAPVLFNSVIEYPIAITLACLLMPTRVLSLSGRWMDIGLLVLRLAVIGGLVVYLGLTRDTIGVPLASAALAVIAVAVISLGRRPLWYGGAIAAILLCANLFDPAQNRTIFQKRSYFGVHRVERDGDYHMLYHGTTVHGAQHRARRLRTEPLTYYAHQGPLGQIFDTIGRQPGLRDIAIIGLGTGTIACHGKQGESWTYYEIDPTVEEIARDAAYFSYLRDCPAKVEVVPGDARLTLADAPDGQLDMLILDAFSSDTIPVHLVTREAFELYVKKIKPGGVLAFHISNKFIRLEPVLGRLAEDLGVQARMLIDDELFQVEDVGNIYESDWVAMSRDGELLKKIHEYRDWRPLKKAPPGAAWTDDFSNVLSVIDWLGEN